jgi:hypothetical protein
VTTASATSPSAAARAVRLLVLLVLLLLLGVCEREILRAMRRLSIRVVVVVGVAAGVTSLPLIPGSHDGALAEKRLGQGEAR